MRYWQQESQSIIQSATQLAGSDDIFFFFSVSEWETHYYALSLFFEQELHLVADIMWRTGKIPIDEPPCGFRGELCICKHCDLLLYI